MRSSVESVDPGIPSTDNAQVCFEHHPSQHFFFESYLTNRRGQTLFCSVLFFVRVVGCPLSVGVGAPLPCTSPTPLVCGGVVVPVVAQTLNVIATTTDTTARLALPHSPPYTGPSSP